MIVEADKPVVFLDACTLVPSSLRDLLLRCAADGLFRVHWIRDILEEVRRTLVHDLAIDDNRVEHLLDTMNRAFPDAEVGDFHALISGLEVDTSDRHVLAAAIMSRSDFVLTRNVRHFPEQALAPFGIIVQSPDTFLVNLASLHSAQLFRVVEERASDLGDSPDETLGFLRRHVPEFVELISRQGRSRPS